jgi:flagellar motor switch protein FliN/FliY
MVDNSDIQLLHAEGSEDASPPKATLQEIEDSQMEIPPELEFLRDIPMSISAELGRTRIQVRNLLQLHVNQILEVEKMVGEPLEIYINGEIVARGEVVVINDKFGIRLTDIINPLEQGLQS